MDSKLRFMLVALVAIVCFAYVASAQLAGGLHNELEADDEIRRVVSEVKAEFEQKSRRQYQDVEPISYRKQVVAGMNYFVKVRTTEKNGNKGHVHLRIYKPFRGPLELTAYQANVDATKKLEYFQ